MKNKTYNELFNIQFGDTFTLVETDEDDVTDVYLFPRSDYSNGLNIANYIKKDHKYYYAFTVLLEHIVQIEEFSLPTETFLSENIKKYSLNIDSIFILKANNYIKSSGAKVIQEV